MFSCEKLLKDNRSAKIERYRTVNRTSTNNSKIHDVEPTEEHTSTQAELTATMKVGKNKNRQTATMKGGKQTSKTE